MLCPTALPQPLKPEQRAPSFHATSCSDVQGVLLGSLDAFYAPLRQELVGRLGVEPSYLDGLYERVSAQLRA